MKFGQWTIAACAIIAAALPAHAQDAAANYPNRIVSLVSPYPAGGMNDVVSRIVGERLAATWKATVVVDNKAGANGNIGAAYAARSPADGYTLLMANGATHGANPALYTNLDYDAVKDFKGVSNVTSSPIVLIVNPKSPFKTVKDLVEYAKANPGKVTFGSSGVGSTGHLAGESFNKAAGISAVHVPYRGDSPAITDVMTDTITMSFITYGSVLSQLEGGAVRALAKATNEKSSILPDVPSFISLDYKDFVFATWFSIVTPAGTPDPIVNKLSSGIQEALRQKPVIDRLLVLGAEPQPSSPAEADKFIRDQIDRTGRMVKELGIAIN